MTCAIGTFHEKYYQPALEKLAYHRPHCRMLGKEKCGAARLAAFKRRPSVRTRRDYAERLAAAFNLEVQHEHFGNGRSLSMEGSSVETFCSAAVDAWKAGVWQMDEADLKMVFHSHLSDESQQDAATTHAHMNELFDQLKAIGELCTDITVWDDTDGCSKQYRCGTAMYLVSVLAAHFGIVIDRAIGAPEHGKDLVDGLNATDKVYLRKMMCMVGTPEANDGKKRMAAYAKRDIEPQTSEMGGAMQRAADTSSISVGRARHSMTALHASGAKKMSLAVESKRLLSDPARFGGVKAAGGKRAKREAEAKMKERHYHVQDPAKVKYDNLKMTAVGFEEGEHNGMLAHYNFRVNKELGTGRVAVRRIPCACEACLAQLDLPWKSGVEAEKQPCFASSTNCIYWPIFKQAAGEPGLNDWKILTFVPTKVSDAEAEEEARAEVLAGMKEQMAELIEDGKYGAFSTLDEDADGYYVVVWTSEPYTLQEDIDSDEHGWKIKAGELVCDAEFHNKVPGASLWYTPTQGEERKVVVRVQQVVAADLKVEGISATNKLPANMSMKNKQHATQQKAVRVDPQQHEVILDEIHRREAVEHDMIMGESSDDESDDEESGEEGKEGEDDD